MAKKIDPKLPNTTTIVIKGFGIETIKALIAFMFRAFFNVYGASILFILSMLLLGFINWLTIPITITPFIVILAMAILTSLLVIFLRVRNKLKTKQSKFFFQELLWKSDKSNNLIGPLCSECEWKMVVSDDQFNNAANAIFGKEPEYIYSCECGNQVKNNIPPSELIRLAKKYYADRQATQSSTDNSRDTE